MKDAVFYRVYDVGIFTISKPETDTAIKIEAQMLPDVQKEAKLEMHTVFLAIEVRSVIAYVATAIRLVIAINKFIRLVNIEKFCRKVL